MNVTIDGCSIYWKVSGAGDEVALILQGWGTSCALYDSIAAMLGETHRVVQLDLLLIVGIADVRVGMVDEIQFPLAHDRRSFYFDVYTMVFVSLSFCTISSRLFTG